MIPRVNADFCGASCCCRRGRIASRMVMRDRIPYIIPKSCGGRMSCIFLVFIPMIGALSLAGLWMYKTKQVSGRFISYKSIGFSFFFSGELGEELLLPPVCSAR